MNLLIRIAITAFIFVLWGGLVNSSAFQNVPDILRLFLQFAVPVAVFFLLKLIPKMSFTELLGRAVDGENRRRMKIALWIAVFPMALFAYILGYDMHRTAGIYWTIAVVLDLTCIILISRYNRRFYSEEKRTDHGSARWATYGEFIDCNQPDKTNDGLWLGGGYFRTKNGHLVTFAPPGQGKGACLIIPNLLIKPTGSYIVTDPKGENACITAAAQKHGWKQNVYILDPWNEQEKINAKHGINAAGFNPLDFLKMDMIELPDNCEMIAYYLVPHHPEAKDHFWEDRARSLIKMLLIHIITSLPNDQHNFWTLYKMLRNDDESLAQLISDMKKNTAFDGLISAAGKELEGLTTAPSTLAGVMSNAQNATKIFESQQLRKSLEKSEFNPFDLSNGNCTVYVVIPERFIQSHSAWLRIVIGLCVKAVNAKPNKRVNFLLDEFAVLGKMDDVQRAYAYGRGQNIVMWTFMQSLSQMKEIYGEAGMNQFINNSMVMQAFGLQDQFSKEYISKMLGEETLMKTSETTGTQSGSTSYSTYARPLLTPEEVGKEPNIITFTESLKYLIPRQKYFENVFSISGPMTDEQAKMMKKGKLPEDQWHKFFMEMAEPAPRVYS